MECLEFIEDVFTIAFFLMLKQYYLNFISAYKKSYSSNHVLLRLTENWKKSRDNKNFVGIVLLDLYLLHIYMFDIFVSFIRE